MNLEGKIIENRYEVIEKIGGGGMATVYKAKDNMLSRIVALKVLRQEFNDDTEFVKRFRAEAQSAASLSNQHIVSVYDVGVYEGNYYIVMEYVEGSTLKEYILKKGALGWVETLKIAEQIADALEVAHKHHIIHRDIKPHNILLTKDLLAKVTDFGIAKVSTSSTINTMAETIGSVHYFSPEHARGGYMDEKSDIYSLGVVMYEMLTGRVPFDADSPVSVAMKHLQDIPTAPAEIKPDIPKTVNDIVLKAMAKNPINRYNNAQAMLKDIREAAKHPDGDFVDLKKELEIPAGSTQKVPVIAMNPDLEEKKKKRVLIRNSILGKLDENGNEILDDEEHLGANSKGIDSDDKIEPSEVDDVKPLSARERNKAEIEADKEKMKKIKKVALPVGIGIGVIALIAIIIILVPVISKAFGGGATEAITVPDFRGKKYDEVKVEYEQKGIDIQNIGSQYDNTGEIEEGCIISQNIDSGTTLKGKVIEVVVSKGIKKVKVPDLTNKEYKVAEYELDALELKYETEFVMSTEVVENFVIKQDQVKDTEVPVGTTIKLTVSSGNGKKKVTMPKLVGLTEQQARDKIAGLGLILTNVTYVKDDTQGDGLVTLQSIPQNTQVEEGTVVTLNVNRLPKSKTIDIDISNLGKDETTPFDLKVTVIIDGVENTVHTGSYTRETKKVSVTVQGYTTATLKIFVDGTQARTQEITF